MKRLIRLWKAYKEARLFETPFKIGTHVFDIDGGNVGEWEIIGFSFGVQYLNEWCFKKRNCEDEALVIAKGVTVSSEMIFQFTLSEIGETAFLSRKEAEAALKKVCF